LAQAPKVLLLDEATAHLDLAHRERTLLRTKKFCDEGNTALVVLHDLDFAVRHCSHVAVLDRGRLVASGFPQTVLSRWLLSEVFGVDAELETDQRGPSLRIYGVVS
jgi:iron complex transport system ATP-binding protein